MPWRVACLNPPPPLNASLHPVLIINGLMSIGELLSKGNRLCTGNGKPGKTWNFTIPFSRPGKSWNLSMGHGKSLKMTKMIFPRTTKPEIPRINDRFHIILKTT